MTKENKDVEIIEEETVIDETEPTDASQNTEEQTDVGNPIPYDRFKQKVDEANALKEKLANIEKEQEKAERKKLEEQNEYKKLYEQAVQQAEEAKATALATKKSALLAQAGYDEEQAQLLVKLVEGETDEEIAESIKTVSTKIPAQDNYGDPSVFNGAKEKPETIDAEELGRSAISKVLHKIKL